MFIKTIAVGPFEPAEFCVTGGVCTVARHLAVVCVALFGRRSGNAREPVRGTRKLLESCVADCRRAMAAVKRRCFLWEGGHTLVQRNCIARVQRWCFGANRRECYTMEYVSSRTAMIVTICKYLVGIPADWSSTSNRRHLVSGGNHCGAEVSEPGCSSWPALRPPGTARLADCQAPPGQLSPVIAQKAPLNWPSKSGKRVQRTFTTRLPGPACLVRTYFLRG